MTLVDSGYGAHVPQTLALLDHALAGRRLAWLVNTHCHSDHMGGNRAVQEKFGCRTTIPAGEAPLIDAWDEEALILGFADQRADRFRYDDTLAAGRRPSAWATSTGRRSRRPATIRTRSCSTRRRSGC